MDAMIVAILINVCSLFGVDVQPPPQVIISQAYSEDKARYFHEQDVIVIYGKKNATPGVIAHELAHAVLSKTTSGMTDEMQEYLAGYAEFKILKMQRKDNGT